MKNYHLIAIGGAVMHNLAIALKRKGYHITGSDDAIYEPSKSNLALNSLLPSEMGWKENRIHEGLDGVILGMHARKDNPELLKAIDLGIPVMSFPEFVAAESIDKKRVVIAGSHGKTSTTAMIMYVLSKANIDFDYLVGSSIDGFELSVQISDAPVIVIEGDEYLSSPIDPQPKFLWYKPHLSIITGIAYDHINVFPTFDLYLQAFSDYIVVHDPDSKIIWYTNDEHLSKLMKRAICNSDPYDTPKNSLRNNQYFYQYKNKDWPLSIIGEHNLQNLEAAIRVLVDLGVPKEEVLKHIADFTGAGRRMEKWFEQEGQIVYRDFAHSPSKLQATVKAVKDTYSNKPLLAVFELHTFSSLNRDFLKYYLHTMNHADQAIVYFDPHVFEHRKMEILESNYVKESFGGVKVCNVKEELEQKVNAAFKRGENILLMSSGTFSNAEFAIPINQPNQQETD